MGTAGDRTLTRHAWNGEGDDESLLRAIEQSVGLADHDPRWADRFAAERARLMAQVGQPKFA
jgi:GrpB-like predicted nucleotidyltransferase (UPF0157 family)